MEDDALGRILCRVTDGRGGRLGPCEKEKRMSRVQESAGEMLAVLQRFEEVREAFQAGKRDGATMGLISIAMDAGRDAIRRAVGEVEESELERARR
jgi:hypothetical protein